MRTKTNNITEDYQILNEELGSGINGKVLCCINKKTNVKYALKTIKDSEKARREVILHWRACQECDNILKIIDIYENKIKSTKMLCLVTELMEGGELYYKIDRKKEPFTEREVAKIMYQICNAIKHLHSLNIAHRDLKPENLLITNDCENETIKLIDFGFAKDGDQGLKTPCYTEYYAAPEILKITKLREIKLYEKSCDIWSLGISEQIHLLIKKRYMLCCKRPPFYSPRDTLNGNFSLLGEDWSKISDDAKQLIRGMLETVPENRLKIDEIVKSKWISYNDAPHTPLLSLDDNENMSEIKESFNNALNEMRSSDNLIVIKNLNEANNPLLRKRRKQ